jgi:hypothetical protein
MYDTFAVDRLIDPWLTAERTALNKITHAVDIGLDEA